MRARHNGTIRLLSLALLGALMTLSGAHALDGSRNSVDREPNELALDVTSGPQCVAVPRPLPGMGIGFALGTAGDRDKMERGTEQTIPTVLEETYLMIEDDRLELDDLRGLMTYESADEAKQLHTKSADGFPSSHSNPQAVTGYQLVLP